MKALTTKFMTYLDRLPRCSGQIGRMQASHVEGREFETGSSQINDLQN